MPHFIALCFQVQWLFKFSKVEKNYVRQKICLLVFACFYPLAVMIDNFLVSYVFECAYILSRQHFTINCLCQGWIYATSVYKRDFPTIFNMSSNALGWTVKPFLTSPAYSDFSTFHSSTQCERFATLRHVYAWKILLYLCHLRMCMTSYLPAKFIFIMQ